jgi:hypothetical protein
VFKSGRIRYPRNSQTGVERNWAHQIQLVPDPMPCGWTSHAVSLCPCLMARGLLAQGGLKPEPNSGRIGECKLSFHPLCWPMAALFM